MAFDVKKAIATRPELAAEEFAARRLLAAIGVSGPVALRRFRVSAEKNGRMEAGGTTWLAAAAWLEGCARDVAPNPVVMLAKRVRALDEAVELYREQLLPSVASDGRVACLAARVEPNPADKKSGMVAMLHAVPAGSLGRWLRPPFCCYTLKLPAFTLVSQSVTCFVDTMNAKFKEGGLDV